MPYIDDVPRVYYSETLEELLRKWRGAACSAGDLTYIIYRFMCCGFDSKRRFRTAAVLIGAVVCAVLEFYRRRVAKYENEKIRENGDVY